MPRHPQAHHRHHRYGTDPDGYDRTFLSEALELMESMVSQPALADVLGDRILGSTAPLDASSTTAIQQERAKWARPPTNWPWQQRVSHAAAGFSR